MGWPMLARCTRIWWVRPVAMAMVARVRPRSRSAPVMRVTAVRARRARVEIFFRSTGSRPSGASMRRPAFSRPHASPRYSFSTSRSAN